MADHAAAPRHANVRSEPRPERLRRRQDFTRVMRIGRRARHPLLQVVARPNGLDVTRIGFAVGRHVGGAVVRNRVKRRLWMIVRDLEWLPGMDIVIVARPGAEAVSYHDLKSVVSERAAKISLLREPDRTHRRTTPGDDA